MLRPVIAFTLATVLGCGAKSNPVLLSPTEGIACGRQVCADGEICALCPEPVCGARPDDAPDFWTPEMLCSGADAGDDIVTLQCDDAGDCEAGLRCEWHGAEAYCDRRPEDGDCALDVPRTPACRTDDDCPECSTGCFVVSHDLAAGRCEY